MSVDVAMMSKKFLFLTVGMLMTTSSFANEIDELMKKANDGDTWSQALVANYYHDNGDYEREFYWTEKLANQGSAVAQFNLAIMYKKGEGVAQNNTLAKEWFGKACENGEQEACEQYQILENQNH